MFEAMSDALALPGRVLEQNLQLSKPQTFARHLQTERANFQRVLFGTAARAAGMHHQIINTKRKRALNFFAKRLDRLEQNYLIGCRKIN